MLIILTNYFPYYRGEEYLEDEIKILAKEFDEILIILTLVSKKMEITRQIPQNVKLITVYYENSMKTKILSLFNTVFNSDFNTKKDIKEDTKKLINRLYDYYFIGRTNESYNQIVKKLDEINIKDKEVVLYSYWFHSTAKIAIKLKNEYFKDKVKYLVSRGHGYDVNEHVSPIKFLPLRKYMLENIDDLFLVSSIKSEEMKNKYPKYSHKIGYSRLGVKENSSEIKSNKDKKIIVSCSMIKTVKRIDKIIEALEILDKKDFEISWYHFGTGPLLEKMEKLANEKLKNIKYEFKGYIKNTELINWYLVNNPSLFINVSESEGVPVSIMEVMSLGIPTIATDVGGTSELVKDNINGILLNKDVSPLEISKSIENLFNLNDYEYEQYSKNAYQTWENDFNANKNYKEFAKNIRKKLDNNE